MRIKYLIISFSIIVLFLSCAQVGDNNVNQNILNTAIIIKYLLKANDFILFIIYLLESDKKYWLNIYSRLYYFYFTLARIKNILQTKKLLKKDHDEIWRLCIKEPKKIFGNNFKKHRVKADYEIIENMDTFVNETNEEIINEHENALEQQLNDITIYVKRYNYLNINDIDNEIKKIKINYKYFIDLLNINKKNQDSSHNEIVNDSPPSAFNPKSWRIPFG